MSTKVRVTEHKGVERDKWLEEKGRAGELKVLPKSCVGLVLLVAFS